MYCEVCGKVHAPDECLVDIDVDEVGDDFEDPFEVDE